MSFERTFWTLMGFLNAIFTIAHLADGRGWAALDTATIAALCFYICVLLTPEKKA